MRDPSGTSRGFAFLTFEDQAAVNAVVAREHVLDGKSVCPVLPLDVFTSPSPLRSVDCGDLFL